LWRFGVLRSLFSGISGLRQHQTMMDVTGNNIANVNTTGFKSSSVVFEDTLSQMVRSAAAPGAGVGGMNPAQVGLGVQLGSIQTNFAQGSAQTTNKASDLMIQGDGFFVMRDGNEQVYSRSGAFTLDTDGFLINSDGMYVQGYQAQAGEIDTNGGIGNIRLQAGSTIPSKPSSNVVIAGNIQAGVDTSTPQVRGAKVYDSRGSEHNIKITMTYNGTDGYDVTIDDPAGGATANAGSITFDGAGARDASTNPTIDLADGTTISIDISGITNYSGVSSADVKSADGYGAGTLQSYQIAPNGTVIGIFSNNEKINLAQVALANFNNPGGLEKLGDSTFRSSANSGLAQVGIPSSGGRGVLQSGTLEMSNVDLGQEFTNLIIAQRGFQANSRVITSSDEMLQELVNIKR
jgi:flagellar hook protein FlgE